MHRGFASNVLPLCASAPVGERSSVSCSSELSSSSSHGQSILAAGFSFIGFVTLYLRPLGMGLWSHGLSCTRSRLILCPVRRPLVLFPLRALGTTITWHGCTTRSRPCSRIILPPRWRNIGYLEVDDNFWVFSSGGFPVQSATGAPRHVRPRSALASSLKGSSHYAVHPGSRPVSFPGSGDPHVFPAQSGVPGIFPVPASTGLHTGVPDGSSLLVRAGYRISHPPSTRCPSADGTSFLKTIARTLKARRVTALTGRSRTPRRSQTSLASGQRGDGHGSFRLLLSLPGESGLTNDSCELFFVLRPFVLFPFFPRVFLTSVTLTLEKAGRPCLAGLAPRRRLSHQSATTSRIQGLPCLLCVSPRSVLWT